MFIVPATEVMAYIDAHPDRQEFHLRTPDGNLVRTLTRHEARTLCAHRSATGDFCVCGKSTRQGLRYLELLNPDPRHALRILAHLFPASGLRATAEDSSTIARAIVAGGITWSFRHAVVRAWSPEARLESSS